MNPADYTLTDNNAAADICARIPGWSGVVHYTFFKSLLAEHTSMKRLLMLGVYHGRDIAFILDILARYHPGRVMEIVGVDKFNAEPCADWPEEKRGMTWEQAFGCAPPSYEAAVVNTLSQMVRIIPGDDEQLLTRCTPFVDCIYLDTSHDEATVLRQLRQAKLIADGYGILCGDDYSDESNIPGGSWGVKRAVSAAFTSHEVFGGWIWYAPASNLRVPLDSAGVPLFASDLLAKKP